MSLLLVMWSVYTVSIIHIVIVLKVYLNIHKFMYIAY